MKRIVRLAWSNGMTTRGRVLGFEMDPDGSQWVVLEDEQWSGRREVALYAVADGEAFLGEYVGTIPGNDRWEPVRVISRER